MKLKKMTDELETPKSRKEQILDEIVTLEKSIEEKQFEWKIKNVEIKNLSDTKDALTKAYEELKKKLQQVSDDLSEHRDIVNRLVRQDKVEKSKVEDLKRELARIIDAEKINAEYQKQIQTFKDSCLEALWRKENRDDDLGAFEYQVNGAIQLAVSKRALLGDKRGLGKSLTSLIYLDLIEAKKVVALCPSDTMQNFAREVMLWTPHRSPIIIGKLPRGERDFLLRHLKQVPQFMLIVNYEAWRRDPKLIEDINYLQCDTVLLDESHNVKNTSTGAYSGAHDLVFANNYCGCGECRPAKIKGNTLRCKCGREGNKWEFSTVKNVLPITGTPILNKPQELFPQLHLIDPENFPSEKIYLRDFCYRNPSGHWTWSYGGEKEVIKKIGPRILVRDKRQAGIIVPPPMPVEHLITQEEFKSDYPRQFKAYEEARRFAQIVLDPDRKIAMSMPAKITTFLRLRQVLVWPAAIELKLEEEDLFIRLNVFESVKIDKVEKLIKEIIEEGERVVVFSQFNSGLLELNKRLGSDSVVYNRTTSEYKRNQIQLDFDIKTVSESPRWQVVLANYKAGGVGLNFNAASSMILLDPEWNPGKEDQAIGRIDRIGQTRDTTIHHIRVERSVDTWMAELIEEKRNIIGGFESEADIYRKAFDALQNGEM